MAEKKMRYRFVHAFIVEGLLTQEGQEIILFDQPDEHRKFLLTGAPDSWLADADKTAAVGARTLSRFTVAGAPPLPPIRTVSDIVNDIRSERRNRLAQRMVLVCQFEGTAGAVKGVQKDIEGERYLFSGQNEINDITAKHEADVDRATASLFAADASVVASEPVAISFRIMAADGSECLAVGLSAGPITVVTRRGIDAEKAIQMKRRFEKCFRSDEKKLKTVTRLLSDSLLAKANKLKSFVTAWTALEVVIHKLSSDNLGSAEKKAPEREKIPFLVARFNSAAENLLLEERETKEASFKKVKKVRDDLIHGKDVEESSLPIEETHNLVRAFLEKVE